MTRSTFFKWAGAGLLAPLALARALESGVDDTPLYPGVNFSRFRIKFGPLISMPWSSPRYPFVVHTIAEAVLKPGDVVALIEEGADGIPVVLHKHHVVICEKPDRHGYFQVQHITDNPEKHMPRELVIDAPNRRCTKIGSFAVYTSRAADGARLFRELIATY